MQHGLFETSRARRVETAVGGFGFHTKNFRTTNRTSSWHSEGSLISGSQLGHGASDLRNDVSCTFDNHRISDADVLAKDLVFVVQGGAGDFNAVNANRLQYGYRSQGSSSANGNDDILQPCDPLRSGELTGDGPAGTAAYSA